MKCIKTKEYNQKQIIKYHEDCSKWDHRKGGFPQIVFYLFYTNMGFERLTGWVAYDDRKAYWSNTKKSAIKRFMEG
jgi:hypothetical protein